MITWSQFEAAAPGLGAFGKQRLQGSIAYLATIRPDGSPRLHPVSPFIAQRHLFLYMEPSSPKGYDLRRDARYTMHCSVEDNTGGKGEFLTRGRAEEISDSGIRELAFSQAKAIGYNPKERYVLFELSIEEAASTVYEDGQPKRIRWTAG